MALSVGFIRFVSPTNATQATGLLTFAPVGLSPTEHASLHWTHTTTLFISLSDAQYNLQVDRAEPGSIPRQCPLCLRHSIVGTAAAASRLMTMITIGLGCGATVANLATRPSPSCRPSRSLTPNTA